MLAHATVLVVGAIVSGQPPLEGLPGGPTFAERPITIAGEVVYGRLTAVHADGSLTVALGSDELTVRLWSIRLPDSETASGQQARELVGAHVGRELELEIKRQATAGGLAAARIASSGRDLGEELLRAGLARYCPRQARTPYLQAAEQEARQARRGLWSQPSSLSCDGYEQ